MCILTGMEIDEAGGTYMLFSPVKFNSFQEAVGYLDKEIENYCTEFLDAMVDRHGEDSCIIWLDSFGFRHYVEFMISDL